MFFTYPLPTKGRVQKGTVGSLYSLNLKNTWYATKAPMH